MFTNHKILLSIFLLIFIILFTCYKFNIIEALTMEKTSNSLQYTSCTQAQNCNNCINANVNYHDVDSPCYWNSTENKCGSFQDAGYSRTCTPTPTPNPGNTCINTTNKLTCVINGCQWNESTGKCGPSPDNTVCAKNANIVDCSKNGCQWDNSTSKCISKSKPEPEPNCPKYTLLQTPVYVKPN